MKCRIDADPQSEPRSCLHINWKVAWITARCQSDHWACSWWAAYGSRSELHFVPTQSIPMIMKRGLLTWTNGWGRWIVWSGVVPNACS